MKRLFVRPEHRGQRIGEHLVRALLLAAREMGYERMRLDTLPSMRVAQELYTELGFYPIPAYNDNPIPSARFLEVRLGAQDC
jgi:ribosomal protein S18 acetylase RimI-like enzyme